MKFSEIKQQNYKRKQSWMDRIEENFKKVEQCNPFSFLGF